MSKKKNAKVEIDFMGNEFFIAFSRDGFIFGVKDDLMKRGKDDHFTELFEFDVNGFLKRITGHWTTNGEHHDQVDVLETLKRDLFYPFLKSCTKIVSVDEVEKSYILFVASKQKLEKLFIQTKEGDHIVFSSSNFAKIAYEIERDTEKHFSEKEATVKNLLQVKQNKEFALIREEISKRLFMLSKIEDEKCILIDPDKVSKFMNSAKEPFPKLMGKFSIEHIIQYLEFRYPKITFSFPFSDKIFEIIFDSSNNEEIQ